MILTIISTSCFYNIQYFKVVTQKSSVPGALLPDTWPQPPCYCGRPVYGHRPWSWCPTPWLTRPSHRSATRLSWGGDPWNTQHSGDRDSAWWSKIGKIIKTHFMIQVGVRIRLIMQLNSKNSNNTYFVILQIPASNHFVFSTGEQIWLSLTDLDPSHSADMPSQGQF